MDVDPRNKYIGKFNGGLSCYMLESKDFKSNGSFILKIEIDRLVSFDAQSIRFRLIFEEV